MMYRCKGTYSYRQFRQTACLPLISATFRVEINLEDHMRILQSRVTNTLYCIMYMLLSHLIMLPIICRFLLYLFVSMHEFLPSKFKLR